MTARKRPARRSLRLWTARASSSLPVPLSLLFLGDAAEELAMATLAAIGLCVGTGAWLASKPSVAAGVLAGIALVVLGVCDFALAAEAKGLALLAPVTDVGFAIKVFAATGAYARAASRAEVRETVGLVKRVRT